METSQIGSILIQIQFYFKHVLGTKIGKANGLSRRPDWKVGVDRDNKNQVVIKDNWIRSLQEVVIEGLEVKMLEKIMKTRSKDEDVIRVVEEMKRTGVKKLQGNKWQLEGELVLKEGKVYVPKDKKLRVEVIQWHHNVPAAGHGGKWKTVELVTRNYWLPGVMINVGKYIEECDLC